MLCQAMHLVIKDWYLVYLKTPARLHVFRVFSYIFQGRPDAKGRD